MTKSVFSGIGKGVLMSPSKVPWYNSKDGTDYAAGNRKQACRYRKRQRESLGTLCGFHTTSIGMFRRWLYFYYLENQSGSKSERHGSQIIGSSLAA